VLLDLILTEIQAALLRPMRLAAIPTTKFQRPVAPGEVVNVSIRIADDEQPQMLRARFKATVDGAPVAEGVFLLADSLAANGG
jgi:3-hydroxymyristoyl/3-hydroxydecanoyl-(acyl carrier protein) dehydratase